MAKIRTMTEGNSAKMIFLFALPLMFGNVFQQMYTVMDTMIVGQALGVQALAALGAADWLNWMVLGSIQGISQGFAILMAQEFGAGNIGRLQKVIGNSAILSAITSILLLILTQCIAAPVLQLLQTPQEIVGMSLLYLRIMFLGVPVVMAYNVLASVLRALGDGKTPLYAMIVASFLNIGLDLLFVLVFHWGIAGAAAATVAAQAFSGIFCLASLKRVTIFAFSKSDFQIESALAGKLLGLGAPMALQNAIIAVGGMIVQFVVNGFGVLFIAGFTATNKLYGVLEIAATSYGYAMVTYVGQNLGARKIKRIRRGVKEAVLIAIVTAALIGVVMLLFGKNILSCFISGTPQEFEQTLEIAYHYLTIMSVCLPVLYYLHVTRASLQGMGDTMLPMLSGIAEFIMRTGAALLLPYLVGEYGIFYAEILAWLGADVVLFVSYLYRIHAVSRKMEQAEIQQTAC
ncbi:MAG: MATE family efflux transporter [bacterium]|nr:MATE family efflux transporter [bacterium]